MKKTMFLFLFFLTCHFGNSQKLFGVVNLTTPFSGTSNAKKYDKSEFKPKNLSINFSWGIDIMYKGRSATHKLSVNQMPFGDAFKIKNKFMSPAYPGYDTLLGFLQAIHEDIIDHFLFEYSLQKESKKAKDFLFRSKILLNYSGGLAISFNRSKTYYRDYFSRVSGGSANNYTYYGYDVNINREGFGFFLTGGAGFDFINKKGKRKLCFNFFYKQGIKKMATFDIHYQYGYFNNPSRQVDMPNQKIYTRGTTFGFSLGVPVQILK